MAFSFGHDNNKPFTKDQVIDFLEKFNEWRRGSDTVMPDPYEIGLALDAAIEILKGKNYDSELKSDHWKNYSTTNGGFRNKTAHSLIQ